MESKLINRSLLMKPQDMKNQDINNKLKRKYNSLPHWSKEQLLFCNKVIETVRSIYRLRPINDTIIEVNLKSKHVIQNRTAEQEMFVLKFLRLLRAISGSLYLHYNSQGIWRLKINCLDPYPRDNNIRCCLYTNAVRKTYKGEAAYISVTIAHSITDIPFRFVSPHVSVPIYKGDKLLYTVDFIRGIFSYLYLKEEFLKEIDKVSNFPMDIANIIHGYLGMLEY